MRSMSEQRDTQDKAKAGKKDWRSLIQQEEKGQHYVISHFTFPSSAQMYDFVLLSHFAFSKLNKLSRLIYLMDLNLKFD